MGPEGHPPEPGIQQIRATEVKDKSVAAPVKGSAVMMLSIPKIFLEKFERNLETLLARSLLLIHTDFRGFGRQIGGHAYTLKGASLNDQLI